MPGILTFDYCALFFFSAFIPTLLGLRLGNQIHPKTLGRERGRDEADKGQKRAPEQGPPKSSALVQQPWQEQEHRYRGDHIPESVKGMAREFFRSLLFPDAATP